MPDKPGLEFHSESPGKRTKASLILFVIAAAIVLLDIIGPVILSSGHDIISSRLHDRLAFLALLSVPFIPILLVVGSILGILEWRTERRASGCANRMTVLAACLNLSSLLIAILFILVALLFLVGPYTDLPRW
ncbi:MAG: hypothetical protein GWN67_25115 [Phycisphaerae bacterium]|nr:hypothetical protein [Phycisphaerae bacterium]NIP55416.1 hypothetical protein [Phycisphaerae bacterium]NIS54087.1 hypothetical protein [Phycisphaerae bacterium]NIU11729.1 hypothetical protein [Phycisphaerae bacterium]NIU59544.1 hypothetical protein [Phycisphaerae bacterium]